MKNQIKSLLPSWLVQNLKRIRGLSRGRWPLTLAENTLRKSADLDSLTGKIRFKMAMDRDPKLTLFADKYLVRDFVEKRVGSKYLSELFAVTNSSSALRDIKLPENFALKSNHGSGAMIIVWDKAPTESHLPKKLPVNSWSKFLIRPEKYVLQDVENITDIWLSQNYYYQIGKFPEWAYKNIDPMLLVEELLEDDSGDLPSDFKFFMINGKCEFIQVDTSRFQDHRRDLFTPNWEKIEGTFLYPTTESKIMTPKKLDEMIEVSEALSYGSDFLRVDLYYTSKGVKFGELTNYPEGGFRGFSSDALDKHLGRNWTPTYSLRH